MAKTIYTINKGINRCVELRGLKAQYIWYLGGALVGDMILFAILYISGLNAYLCVKPEIFTMSGENYEALHQTWVKAIKVLPPQTVVHLQDWFVQLCHQSNPIERLDSFLAVSSDRFFQGRPWLDHWCWLFLTKKPAGRKPATSAVSGLFRKTLVPEETHDPAAVEEFPDHAGQFARILTDSGLLKVRRLATNV